MARARTGPEHEPAGAEVGVLLARLAHLEHQVRYWRDRACRQHRRAELWRERAVRYHRRRRSG